MSKSYHKKYTLHCKTLSPVHIGSGEVLSRWEYYCADHIIYSPNDSFWNELTKKSDIFERIINNINYDSPGKSLTYCGLKPFTKAFLEKHFSVLHIKSNLGYEEVELENRKTNKITKEKRFKIRNINLFFGSPNYFIPGSSIKGAIRTGITVNELNKKLSLVENSDNGVKKLQEEENVLSKIDSYISKDFQSIYVTDVSLNPAHLSINPVSYLKDDKDFQLYETINSNVSFVVNITNTFYKHDKNNSNFCEIFQKTTSFYKTIWNQLKSTAKNPLDKFYKSQDNQVQNAKGLLRLGFGAGQLSNSILHFWKEAGKDDAHLYSGNAKKMYKDKKIRFEPYPSTVKMTNNMPLGWVLITDIKEENVN